MSNKLDWQPIETAPSGFAKILTYDGRQKFEDRFVIKTADGEWWREHGFAPTHWMPLPDPPQD